MGIVELYTTGIGSFRKPFVGFLLQRFHPFRTFKMEYMRWMVEMYTLLSAGIKLLLNGWQDKAR